MAERVIVNQAGGWNELQIESFTSPEPQPDEVQIDVSAIGINFADVGVRQGLYSSARKMVGWPITPGFEVAGTVSRTGGEVTELEVGQRVMAATFFGGYSTELTVKSPFARPIPDDMSFENAAGIPAVFMTAYYATRHLARIHPGSNALVHSAAGGVGLAVTQVLREQGAQVVGVVGSPSKIDTALEYGASHVIDKSTQDLWEEAEVICPEGFDQIFDPNGIGTLKQSYNHLAVGGLLFVYGFQSMLSKNRGKQNPITLASRYLRMPRFNPRLMVQENRSVMGFNISYLFDRTDLFREGLAYIMDNFEAETFKPLPVTTYPFEQVAQAHQDIESGTTTGKLILSV